ncbi:protein kinase [Streptomyces sp. NPDC047525]|uniref:protein kinase domain-containing protein n=1 Tax=Streptomyces sp. NPDC047525 TaxID=3155264 RepID=UPI0033EFBF3E
MSATLPGGDLLPGDPRRLGGHRIIRRLGSGGMGQVYLGRSPGGRLVAVKTVHEHLAADPHFRERFRREASAARAVTGAHTAAVLDADPDSPLPWLATAFLPGVTLRRAVAACPPFGADVVRSLGACLAEALSSIHAAGIVHRDLKPSNVLLTSDGPRVIDFGIARVTGDLALTEAGSMIGTPGFMAPEQIEGRQVGPPADVFALGAVLAFAAGGGNPFGSAPVAVLLYRATHEEPRLTDVPARGGLRELVAECLAKDPALRPTVDAVLVRASAADAPLWWREEPLRSVISGREPDVPDGPDRPDRPDEGTARATPVAPSATAVAPSATAVAVSPTPAHPDVTDRADRRRTLTRRGLIVSGGGGLAGIAAWAISRPSTKKVGASNDGLLLRKGSRRPGKVRWSLTSDGGTLDAFLLAGSTVLVHGTKPYARTEGQIRAVAAGPGTLGWRSAALADAPALWGVAGGVLVAPGLVSRGLDLRTGDPWEPKDAWPAPGVHWFAVAGRRLVTLATEGSATDRVLRSRALPAGGSSWALEDAAHWYRPAVFGASLLLVPDPAEPSFDTSVVCIDAGAKKRLWTYAGLAGDEKVVAAPVALPGSDGRAARFALLTDQDELHLLDVRRDTLVERRAMDVRAATGTTALGHASGTGLLLAGGQKLIGFDPGDGKQRWSFPTAGLDTSWPRLPGGGRGPVTAHGVLLHWTDSKALQAIDLATGEKLWTVPFADTARVPPAVGGATVYATAGRVCRALTLRGGKVVREWPVAGDIAGLAADASGWYARIGDDSVRAVNAVVAG